MKLRVLTGQNIIPSKEREIVYTPLFTRALETIEPNIESEGIYTTANFEYLVEEINPPQEDLVHLVSILNTLHKARVTGLGATFYYPEAFLHPQYARSIANWVIVASRVVEIEVLTQSPELLDKFTSYAQYVYVKDYEGVTNQLNLLHLQSFINEGWELGDLYRVGEPSFGGWFKL